MPCRKAISSMSLGRAWVHELPNKLDQAALHGFRGLELFHEDLEYLAAAMPGGATPDNQLLAATQIHDLCSARGITVLCLQPFMHYEGLRDRIEHAMRIEKMRLWLALAKRLHTTVVAIPSSFLPRDQVSGDMDLIVSDLREVADMGARENPPVTFAYEALAWGTHVDTWEESWEVVQRVDRPNFGLCLDSFNIAGRIYADPAAEGGVAADAEAAVKESVARLLRDVDPKKVVYVQVVDAERLDKPLLAGHDFYNAEQPARMSWSRNCRLFYREEAHGAYLPVRDICDAIFNGLGIEGWVSMELFNRCMADEHPETPARLAKRAAESWTRLVEDLNLVDGDLPQSSQDVEPEQERANL
ncbi:3-dehydroshikimate dehydratase [Diplodia corticola]|uniref:3-dehydroshikimate dehydratase n=1 Tax=Diplodia corticola TaxID=236234 RepID=A0A1J9QKU0_9PEZI|nr:3-dehydroshikimate dehydratase [Diplodia corticola]OJD28682.1 3-dehydroshikimate dehydratase [Diplodia corticola]